MRRALVSATVVLSIFVLAAPTASALTPTERRLTAQIKTLQRQVRTLQRQMRQTQVIAAAGIVYGACTAAVTADAFQSTWSTIDQRFGTAHFGAQTPVTDFNTCQAFRITRARIQVPPTTAVFQSLLNLLRS